GSRDHRDRRRRDRGPPAAAGGGAALPVHQRRRHRGAGADRRHLRDRPAHHQAQVRALLALPRRRRHPSGASGGLRPLRVQHRRHGRSAEVGLITRPGPRPSALPWLLLSAAVIALDQWSKAWVLSSLPEFVPVPVTEGFWNWYRTYNSGAAFSCLANAGGWQI